MAVNAKRNFLLLCGLVALLLTVGPSVYQYSTTVKLLEQSSAPAPPGDGESIMWMSDGTGFGDDGDVCMAITAGGTTTRIILYDHSSGGAW